MGNYGFFSPINGVMGRPLLVTSFWVHFVGTNSQPSLLSGNFVLVTFLFGWSAHQEPMWP